MISTLTTTTQPNNAAVLIPTDDSRAAKDQRSRLSLYCAWLESQGMKWYQPDLAAYRDKMLAMGKQPSTVQAALSTIRARYQAILRNRDLLFALAPNDLPFMEQQALVNEAVVRIQNTLHPDHAKVSVTKHQDVADSDHLRLTSAQANTLLRQPDPSTVIGLRDLAMIALMLCTGIREMELAQLTVNDLRQALGGELALHVRQGKGNKSRLVPYGDLDWCVVIVERWLAVAGITEDAIFRGFYKGGKRVRQTAITERAIEQILDTYPITIDGRYRTVKPHDLRRTYARRLYEAGVEVVAIQQNLGHADLKTTLGYIGTLDAGKRRAKAVYDYDLSQLPETLV